eukprot:RCo012690
MEERKRRGVCKGVSGCPLPSAASERRVKDHPREWSMARRRRRCPRCGVREGDLVRGLGHGVELFDAADDVLAVGVPPQRRDVGSDVVEDHPALAVVRQVDDLLHDVVRVLVLHHHLQGRGAVGISAEEVGEDLLAIRGVAVLEDLLHDVAGELVLRQLKAVRAEPLNDGSLVGGLAVDQHVLHHVVSVLVPHQGVDILQDLIQNGGDHLVVVLAVLQDALDDAAPVCVHGEVLDVPREAVDDERDVLWGDPLDALLDHVVAVLVQHTPQNVAVQLTGDHVLVLLVDDLQRLLDHPAAVGLQGQRQHVTLQHSGQELAVAGQPVLEKLLDHVVAEDISHQPKGLLVHLVEHQVLLGVAALRALQLALDQPRALLVPAELHHVALQVGQFPTPRLDRPELLHQPRPGGLLVPA